MIDRAEAERLAGAAAPSHYYDAAADRIAEIYGNPEGRDEIRYHVEHRPWIIDYATWRTALFEVQRQLDETQAELEQARKEIRRLKWRDAL